MKVLILILLSISLNAQTRIDTSYIKHCARSLVLIKNKQGIGRGTGFIVHNAGNDFLVTNYHVLTGKAIITDSILGPTPEFVMVGFTNKTKTGINYLPYPLYAVDKPKYLIISNQIDIAVLPIFIPDTMRIKQGILYVNDFDTSINIQAGRKIYVSGYPRDCVPKDKWQPCIFESNSIVLPFTTQYFGVLWYDKYIIGGSSGAPAFIDNQKNGLKIIGVHSINLKIDENPYGKHLAQI